MAQESRALAKFAAELDEANVPDHVRARAIDLLVDQIGVQIGCSDLPWARKVRDLYLKPGSAHEATIIRYGDRASLHDAIFINSTFGHSFEYDDGNPQFLGHPGGELVPTLLAIAEANRFSGRQFLSAFIAGYELRGRIGWALFPDFIRRGGPQHSTACGPFGAAAAVAKLLGLDAEGIHNALGIAGAFSGGLMQYDHGGGSVKRIYNAVAATSGLQAAMLAKSGITGPEGIIEGANGILKIYGLEYRPERLLAEIGTKWMFETVYFKPYCVVGIIASGIDGMRQSIAALQLNAANLARVEVGYPTGFHAHAAITEPRDLLSMQFSTSYSLALTLLKGGNTPREYTEAALADPQIREVASKISVVEEAELTKTYPNRMFARVKAHTTDGRVHEELVLDAKGSPAVPLTSTEVDDKFRSQVKDVLGDDACEKLLSALRNIRALDDLSLLPPLFTQTRARV